MELHHFYANCRISVYSDKEFCCQKIHCGQDFTITTKDFEDKNSSITVRRRQTLDVLKLTTNLSPLFLQFFFSLHADVCLGLLALKKLFIERADVLNSPLLT